MSGFDINNVHTCEDFHLWLHTSSNIAEHINKYCISKKSTCTRGGAHIQPAQKTLHETTMNTKSLQNSIQGSISKDLVGQTVISDPLLMELGMYRAGENFENQSGKLKYARDRTRRMARLVLHMSRPDNLTAILIPDNFEQICDFAL